MFEFRVKATTIMIGFKKLEEHPYIQKKISNVIKVNSIWKFNSKKTFIRTYMHLLTKAKGGADHTL